MRFKGFISPFVQVDAITTYKMLHVDKLEDHLGFSVSQLLFYILLYCAYEALTQRSFKSLARLLFHSLFGFMRIPPSRRKKIL